MVIEQIKVKRTIESLEKSATLNVGDIVTCSIDKKYKQYRIIEFKRVRATIEDLTTQVRYGAPISTLTLVK